VAARKQPRQRGLNLGRPPRRFALDESFPQPIVALLTEYLRDEAELVPMVEIDPRLTESDDDWRILLSLHQRGGWDGLITTNSGMLSLPRELAVLMQTKLSLVVAEESGHDPLRATGLLLLHLPGICRDTTTKPQVWRLRAPGRRPAIDPWEELARVADRQGERPADLYAEGKLSRSDLERDPLEEDQ
jgi:hypothetical protein